MSFDPDHIDSFKKIFNESRQQIMRFDGCSHVELLQDEDNHEVFFTFSSWQSEEHLDGYRNSELFKRVWGATKALFNDRPQAWTVKELQF